MKGHVLITGGSGFLGKRLGRSLNELGYQVTLAARNHRQLLKAQAFSKCDIMPMDVFDRDSIRRAFLQVKPDVVIHGAATKFVDLAEKEPLECCDINVTGSANVAKEAIACGVSLVLGIGTDKASPPIMNTYGLTKALMEKMFCGLNHQQLGSRFLTVRYGNVAWSTGSVLPIWRKMIENEGVLRTCGPEMYRFFFTVEEAVALVLYALKHAEKETGIIISKRMKAAKMMRVAQNMHDKIEILPPRPGDCEEELLIGTPELHITTEFIDPDDGNIYYFIRPNQLPQSDEIIGTPISEKLTSRNTDQLDDAEITTILNAVPEEELDHF
ncbi:hypothetical protein BVX99_02085 [bacterium F16]|nr:hypothetical protein BVX99_02085 [bacterium F16]